MEDHVLKATESLRNKDPYPHLTERIEAIIADTRAAITSDPLMLTERENDRERFAYWLEDEARDQMKRSALDTDGENGWFVYFPDWCTDGDYNTFYNINDDDEYEVALKYIERDIESLVLDWQRHLWNSAGE